MRPSTQTLSVLILIYLLSGGWGIISLFSQSALQQYYAIVCIGCLLLGLLGLWAVFNQRPILYRNASLWAIGIPSLVYVSNEVQLIYPTFLHIPLTLVGIGENGVVTKFGVDAIPAILFLLDWFLSKPQKLPASHESRVKDTT